MVVRLRPAHVFALLCVLTASLTPLSAPPAALAVGVPGSSTERTPAGSHAQVSGMHSGLAPAGAVTATIPAVSDTATAAAPSGTAAPLPTPTASAAPIASISATAPASTLGPVSPTAPSSTAVPPSSTAAPTATVPVSIPDPLNLNVPASVRCLLPLLGCAPAVLSGPGTTSAALTPHSHVAPRLDPARLAAVARAPHAAARLRPFDVLPPGSLAAPATGVIPTVAGNGSPGCTTQFTPQCYGGDGGPATKAALNLPTDVAVDKAGNLYIADSNNDVVREVLASTGIITTVAGYTSTGGFSGDGGPATRARFRVVEGVALDAQGNLYISDAYNFRVREVLASTGVITTVAGDGSPGCSYSNTDPACYGGDGGPATQAHLNVLGHLSVDSSGTLYIADELNDRVRAVASGTGIITTVAGNGSPQCSGGAPTNCYGGDGGPATQAELDNPYAVTSDAVGDLFISDFYNNRIRVVSAGSGLITTAAGNGSPGCSSSNLSACYGGDGGPATQAALGNPVGLLLDGSGDLVFADKTNFRIREIGNLALSGLGGAMPWHPHHAIALGNGLGLSIDLADGHVDLSAPAMYIPGRGPDLAADQTWDSTRAQAGVTSTLGMGWISSLSPRMSGPLTGTVTYAAADGAQWAFVYTGSPSAPPPYTSYRTPPGLPWQLSTAPTGSTGYTLTNVLSGEMLRFDTSGRYLSDTDAYGNQNTLSYTGTADLPTLVANSGGRALHLFYNGAGQLDAVQSPLSYASGNAPGQEVAYGVSGGQLTSMAWGYGTADQTGATFGYSGTQLVTITTGIQGTHAGHTWFLGYDNGGRASYVLSPVSGTLGQAGYTPSYTTLFLYGQGQTELARGYKAAGQQMTLYTLDAQGEPITVTDGLGDASAASYDADHDVTSSTDQDNNTTANYYQYVGPNGSTGLITETVQPPIQPYSPLNGGMDQPTTRHYYNASTNDLIETDLPEGGKELYGYDGHHSVVTSTELLNSSTNTWRGTINAYDGYVELTAVTDGRGVNVNSSGVASLAPSASQYTAHTTYTTAGDVQSAGTAPITTTLNGTLQVNIPVTTTYGYDADGNQTGLISPNGQVSGSGYDHLGRLVTSAQPHVTLYNGQVVYPTETTGYNADSEVVTQTDGNGDVTLDSYDPWNRLVAETNPISGTTVYTDNATAQTAVRDPMGNPTSYQYDAAGRLITQTAPLTGTTLFQYDPAGNTTAITTQDSTNGTAVQVETRGYDSLNRVLTDTISGPSQPPTTTLTRYDHNGNVFQVQQPNGDVVVNTYDFANQLTNTHLYGAPISGPSGATGPSYDAYNYDQAGNVTDHYDADGRHTTTAYDGDNRLAQTIDTTSTGTITTTPQYDPDSNVLTQTMQTVDLTQPGVQQTHTLTNTYNAADWLMSTGDDGLVSSYQYDAAGQPRSETILNGQAPVTTVLDPEGRATAIGENLGGTGPYSSTFVYNANDLPMTVTLHSDTPSAQVQQSAQYDANSNLTHLTASGPSGVSNPLNSRDDYAYNAAGWTTAMTWTVNGAVTATQISHNALGRITSWTGQIHGPETWAYDGNGNIISNTEFISDAIRTTTFTYSQTTPNQLDQQQTQGLGVEYFGYDSNGNTTSLTSTDPATYPNGQLDPYHANIHVGSRTATGCCSIGPADRRGLARVIRYRRYQC